MSNIIKRCMSIAVAVVLAVGCIVPAALAEDKKETVFVIADASGAPDHVVVSERLYNPDGLEEIRDYSELQDIENVSDAQTFSNDGGVIVWQAGGEDVQYEGTSDKPLPVDVKVTYRLDGQPVEPADLKGRSGHLDIRLEYSVSETRTVEIDGVATEIPVPFLMASVLFIDPDVCDNVTVENGKLVDAGNLRLAVCIGMPGVGEALALESYEDLDIELPTTATISADVKNYSNSGMYTFATSSPLENLDVENGELGELRDIDFTGMSDDLADAITQLKDGSRELADGVQELKDGADDLKDGAHELSDSLNEIDDNSDDLVDGAKQLFEGILDTANEGLREKEDDFAKLDITLRDLTIANYESELERLEKELLENVEDYVYEEADRLLRQKVYDAVHAEVVKKVHEAARATVTDKENEAAVTTEERTINFEVRSCGELKDLDSTHYRVAFHGDSYDIQTVDFMNYQKKTIRIVCKLQKKGGA